MISIVLTACGYSGTPDRSGSAAEKVLDLAVMYHDPDDAWRELQAEMTFLESRPAEKGDTTFIWLRNNEGYFQIRRPKEEHGMLLDSGFVIAGNVDRDRIEMLRNYYLYLWGLPMKLRDQGTDLLSSVDTLIWNDKKVLKITAEYATDVWDFYFDFENYALAGYRFVKNNGEGEWIELYGIERFGNMRIPKERRWYVLSDSTYLGTDILTKITALSED